MLRYLGSVLGPTCTRPARAGETCICSGRNSPRSSERVGSSPVSWIGPRSSRDPTSWEAAAKSEMVVGTGFGRRLTDDVTDRRGRCPCWGEPPALRSARARRAGGAHAPRRARRDRERRASSHFPFISKGERDMKFQRTHANRCERRSHLPCRRSRFRPSSTHPKKRPLFGAFSSE
jgi:hypothetical protein